MVVGGGCVVVGGGIVVGGAVVGGGALAVVVGVVDWVFVEDGVVGAVDVVGVAVLEVVVDAGDALDEEAVAPLSRTANHLPSTPCPFAWLFLVSPT